MKTDRTGAGFAAALALFCAVGCSFKTQSTSSGITWPDAAPPMFDGSIAERGEETLRISGRARTGLRFLAVTGLVHTWYIVGYFVPYSFFALKADTFPAMLDDALSSLSPGGGDG